MINSSIYLYTVNVNGLSEIYDQLIDRSRDRVLDGYTEKHHIIPKSMCGSNKKSNIAEAARSIGITYNSIIRRIREEKYTEYFYI